jgi:hypothetical protein
MSTGLRSVVLGWKKNEGGDGGDGKIGIPVYLNADRADLLFIVDIAASPAIVPQLVQQAVALVAV